MNNIKTTQSSVANKMFEGRKDFSEMRVLDEKITMSDGVTLRARVYLPPEPITGAFPALYVPSAYQLVSDSDPASSLYLSYEVGPLEWYVREHGYAFVRLDVRGSGQSEGEYTWWSEREQRDHYEAIEWIAQQPWSTGKIGGFGQSYYGVAQWLYALQQPPHLTCIAPFDALTEPYTDGWYHGGIPSGFGAIWYNSNVRMQTAFRNAGDDSGRVISYDAVADWLRHPTQDDYWRERSAQPRLAEIKIPSYSIGAWGKRSLHLRGNIRGFQGAGGPKWLRIEQAQNVFEMHHMFHLEEFHERTLLPFYDHFLKGIDNGFEDTPQITTWLYGAEEFRTWTSWPPTSQERDFFLTSDASGSVASLNDGGLVDAAPDEVTRTTYVYPHPEWRLGNAGLGPNGPDLISYNVTFTSAPLDDSLVIVGHPTFTLYASSDQTDTDFVVTIYDQAPDSEREEGLHPRSVLISRGLLRASHRELDETLSTPQIPIHNHADPKPLVPGKVYKFLIELSACAYTLKVGHRLRLMVAPTDSSVDEGIFEHHYSWQRVGSDTVYHDVQHPSHITLPVVSTQHNEDAA